MAKPANPERELGGMKHGQSDGQGRLTSEYMHTMTTNSQEVHGQASAHQRSRRPQSDGHPARIRYFPESGAGRVERRDIPRTGGEHLWRINGTFFSFSMLLLPSRSGAVVFSELITFLQHSDHQRQLCLKHRSPLCIDV